MGKRAGLKYTALKRLDRLMADGQKRSEAKAQAAVRSEATFAFTDSKMHSFQTRTHLPANRDALSGPVSRAL